MVNTGNNYRINTGRLAQMLVVAQFENLSTSLTISSIVEKVFTVAALILRGGFIG